MVFGWRAGVHRQGYALVCASKTLDILVVVIDRMTRVMRKAITKTNLENLQDPKTKSLQHRLLPCHRRPAFPFAFSLQALYY